MNYDCNRKDTLAVMWFPNLIVDLVEFLLLTKHKTEMRIKHISIEMIANGIKSNTNIQKKNKIMNERSTTSWFILSYIFSQGELNETESKSKRWMRRERE